MPSDGSQDDANASSAATALRRLAELTEHLTAALFWNTGSNFARRAGNERPDQDDSSSSTNSRSNTLTVDHDLDAEDSKDRKK